MRNVKNPATLNRVRAGRSRSAWAALTICTLLLVAFSSFPLNGSAQRKASKGSPKPPRPRNFTPDPTTQKKVFEEVKGRLLAVVRNHPGRAKYVWPPPITLEPRNEINAYADVKRDFSGNPIKDEVTGKFLPLAIVTQSFMDEVAQDDADRLALVLGHELAHLLLGHVLNTSQSNSARTNTTFMVFRAEEEHQADILGMKLALAANYSIRGAREVWSRVMDPAFLNAHPEWKNYTSFEGVGKSHPSWSDRFALIDKEKQSLWKAMSSFENGVYFLTFQNYAQAEEAFKYVVDETGCNEFVGGRRNCRGFPDSFDAHANLGYALLMQYFDKLDQNDLARFKVGQLVTGSFYTRPISLAPQVKGVDADLWTRAVASLKKSLELNPNATLAKANLGIAYLMAPLGKNVPEATKHLEAAAQLAPRDQTLTQQNRSAVFINSAVALMAAGAPGDRDKAKARLDAAAEGLKNEEIDAALKHNRALLLAQSAEGADRENAVVLLDDYLKRESQTSLWWNLGYGLYKKLAIEQGRTPLTQQQFAERSFVRRKLRPVTSVDLGPGILITLSDPLTSVHEKLGTVKPVPVVTGTNLVRLFYPDRGVEIVAMRRVVAVFLRGDKAPELIVRLLGTGERTSVLRIGMTMPEVQEIINERSALVPITDPEVEYYFYPGVGVAIHYDGNKKVNEIVITQAVVG